MGIQNKIAIVCLQPLEVKGASVIISITENPLGKFLFVQIPDLTILADFLTVAVTIRVTIHGPQADFLRVSKSACVTGGI